MNQPKNIKISVKLLFYLVMVEHMKTNDIKRINEVLIAAQPKSNKKFQQLIQSFFDFEVLVKAPKLRFAPLFYNTLIYDLNGNFKHHPTFKIIQKENADFFGFEKIKALPIDLLLVLC